MSIRDQRNQNREAIYEGRFIKLVLERNAAEMDKQIEKVVSPFRSPFWSFRNFTVNDNVLEYDHAKELRFVNMRTRMTKTGIKRKKAYKTHNQPLFHSANDVVRELTVGYTDAVREEMMKLDGTEM